MKRILFFLNVVVLIYITSGSAIAGLQTLSMENTDGAFVTVVKDTATGSIWWQDLTTFKKVYPGGEVYEGQIADIALMSPIVGYDNWHMSSLEEFDALLAAATVATDPYLDLSGFDQFIPTEDSSSNRYWEGLIDEEYDSISHYSKIVNWWIYAEDEGYPQLEWKISDGRVYNIDSPTKGAWVTAQPTIPIPGTIILTSIGAGLVGWLRRRKVL